MYNPMGKIYMFLLAALVWCSLAPVQAAPGRAEQGRQITGKVAEEDGNGLPGVSVLIQGTTEGTVTDNDGKFTITVPSGESILTFSFIGYVTQNVTVGNLSVVDVAMVPDVTSLKLSDPGRAFGELAPYVQARINRTLRPERLQGAHPAFAGHVGKLAGQVNRLRDGAESALRKHGKKIQEKQLVQKRLAEAASGIYSQVAVISRASAVFARDGEPISGAEKTVAMNYLKKTEREVAREFRGLEVNDDKYVSQIGRTVRDRKGYPFSL